MGVAIKAVLAVAGVLVLALLAYGYLADFAPQPQQVTQPVVLDAK